MVDILSQGYLSESLGKGKGFLIIAANSTGLIYQTDIINGHLQIDPDGFIEKNDLKPLCRLFWNERRQKTSVIAVHPDGTLDLESNLDPALHKKALKLIDSQIPTLHTKSEYFPQTDLEMLAISALMKQDPNIQPDVAKGNIQRLFDDLNARDRVILSRIFDVQVNPALAAALDIDSDQLITIDVKGKVVNEYEDSEEGKLLEAVETEDLLSAQ